MRLACQRVSFAFAGLLLLTGRLLAADTDLEFFEKRVRPLLAEHCLECHSPDKKVKGGLRLDIREGWQKGGDTGPALVPGKPAESLLIQAIRYEHGDLQMPPKRRLTAEQVADLEKWVTLGAPDPRTGTLVEAKKPGMSLEEGRKFWAYQLPKKTAPPAVKDAAWPKSPIDSFILARLEDKALKPVADADRVTLVRRLYFDLIGLPPTPEQIDAFVNDRSPQAYDRLVDQLLASPHFGERWGRHWLDVARYAESLTLRGFVFKEAWRYRDYVINAFNQDLPFNQFIREQIAGDLMKSDDVAVRQQQVVATAFLVLGNMNLEEQDKNQLRMDVVDEQLDTLGKAFLAQTIGCARCHDHKFDPIPTRDYYALAGILRNTKTLEHSNVSKWIEVSMPLPPEEEQRVSKHEQQVATLQAQIKDLKAQQNRAAVAKLDSATTKMPAVVAPEMLTGVVVDDTMAKRVGEWKESKLTRQYIGQGYLHDENKGRGTKTLTFVPELPKAGKYEVRFAYSSFDRRATKVPVTVFSADGENMVEVNERLAPPIQGRFVSLGQYRFEPNGQGFVLISNDGVDGVVTADAVQFIPVEKLDVVGDPGTATDKTAGDSFSDADLKRMEKELKSLNESGPVRPKVMSVREETEITDSPIHIRGSVHTLGEVVPRGFLQVATYGKPASLPADGSGRRELAEWLASDMNPLPARVIVNRAWHWLFGAGLVRTTDNFGTTGDRPSHPELLDYLAVQFMEQGWSMKQLVRELVRSHVYQLASTDSAPAYAADPENRLLAHMNRRRMEAEEIRDTLLSVAGRLELDLGGSLIKPGVNADFNYQHTTLRRSVYDPVFRNSLPELFEVFDFADPSMVTGRRNNSTVAPQALFLMNHPFVIEQARFAAQRSLAESGDDVVRINVAYRRTLGRLPSDAELKLVKDFLNQPGDATPEARWTELYQTLFACLDFRYLN